jgi:hypothetical protein
MYVLIDETNAKAIAVSEHYNALAGLSVIQYANVDCTIVPLDANREFASFDLKQLLSIAAGIGMPHLAKSTAYPAALKLVREAISRAEWLRFPFTKEQVFEQVATLAPGDDKPLYFNPEGGSPLPAKAWQAEPQRNRKRADSSYWVNFASDWLKTAPGSWRAGTTATPPPAVAPGKRTSTRPAAPPATGGTTPTPKPRAAHSGPPARPKPGTSTGKVWEFADTALAAAIKDGDPREVAINDKALRKAVISLCEAEGINASTASVQFGKWKSSQ